MVFSIKRYAVVLLTLLCNAVVAEESATLTGDWGGTRTHLTDAGIDLTGDYNSEISTNPRGGAKEQQAYVDQWRLSAKFDLQKLLAWQGASFLITITDRNGNRLDNRANLGTLQEVQDTYGGNQTWRLTDFWFGESFFDGRLTWKIGRVTVNEDFANYRCDFQNLTFCGASPGHVSDAYWYNSPVSEWGTQATWAVVKQLDLKIGVYQVNPTYGNQAWAEANALWPNFPRGTTGALIPLGLLWKPAPWGRAGSYKFGIWYSTADANDVFLNSNGQPLVIAKGTPLRRNSSSGNYFNFEQPISGEVGGVGARVFFNGLTANDETTPGIDRQLALGIEYKGLFATRPQDFTGIAIGTNRANRRIAEGAILVNEGPGKDVAVHRSEYVAETFYSWWPLKFFNLRPCVQYIIRPGGVANKPDVLVIGMRTAIVF
jgi:porin